MSTIYVIGAGVRGHEEFGQRALALISQAALLVGGERQLALVARALVRPTEITVFARRV